MCGRSLRILFLMALSACMAWQAAAAQTSLKKVTIIIGSPGLINSLHYIAEGAGFFKDEGLDVETVQVPSGTQQLAAILGGSADAAPTNLEQVIRSYARGSDMVAMSRIYDIFPYVLVLSNKAIAKSGIKDGMPIDEKVKRLKGLKIGITSVGSGTDSFIRSLLLARGMSPDKEITVQPMGSADGMLTALQKGLIDGFSFIPPYSEIPAQQGYGKVVIDPITGEVPELKDVPYMVVATSRRHLQSAPKTMLAITRAYTRAIKLLQDDPDRARQLVRKYLRAADDKTFNAVFQKYIAALPANPVITRSQVQNMVNWMNFSKAQKPLKIEYGDVTDSVFATQAAKAILHK